MQKHSTTSIAIYKKKLELDAAYYHCTKHAPKFTRILKLTGNFLISTAPPRRKISARVGCLLAKNALAPRKWAP